MKIFSINEVNVPNKVCHLDEKDLRLITYCMRISLARVLENGFDGAHFVQISGLFENMLEDMKDENFTQ